MEKEAEVIQVRDEPHLEIEPAVTLPKVENIQHNFGIIKEYAEKLKEFWEPVIIEEKDIASIKPKRTKIKNLQDAIARYRIDTIKDFKKPIDDFEKTCKQIEATLKETYESLGNKIKVFEDLEKSKKQEIISKIIQEKIVEKQFEGSTITEDVIIFDSRWLNKTYDIKTVETDIDDQILTFIKSEEQKKENQKTLITFLETVDPNNILQHEKYIERLKYVNDVNLVMKDIQNDLTQDTLHIKNESNGLVVNTNHNVFEETSLISVCFAGTYEQVEKLRQYAFELGMEEF